MFGFLLKKVVIHTKQIQAQWPRVHAIWIYSFQFFHEAGFIKTLSRIVPTDNLKTRKQLSENPAFIYLCSK
jgi:hypothetical protein